MALKLDANSYGLSLNNNLVTLLQSFDNQSHGATTNYRVLVRYDIYNGGSAPDNGIVAQPPHVTFAFPIT
jgi:hypothetical protein